jgi:hypothetical protein
MKSTTDGKIESFELEGENAVASAIICHNSGASLYFRYILKSFYLMQILSLRSSQEMADLFVKKMTEDLGLNFGGKYCI